MFPLSKYFGIFPFHVIDNRLVPLKYFYAVLLILLCMAILHFSFVNEDIKNYLQTVKTQSFIRVFISLKQILSFIPMVSVIWIRMNVRKFTKMLETFRKINNLSGIPYNKINRAITVCHLIPLFRVLIISYRCVLKPSRYCNYSVLEAFSIVLNILQTYLVIIQFIDLSSSLKYQFHFLSRSLSKENAEEWTKCHEALRVSSRILSCCYSPQLFLFIGSIFITAIIDVYVNIMSSAQRTDLMHNIISVLRNVFGIATTWYIVSVCSGTVDEAKKFDKSLYQLTINDTTGNLLKNKKIILHFKANQQVEFSVMIFFNLDYNFLCRMIYTATTYIVILVQFS